MLLVWEIACAKSSENHWHAEWCNFGGTLLLADRRWHATIVLHLLHRYVAGILTHVIVHAHCFLHAEPCPFLVDLQFQTEASWLNSFGTRGSQRHQSLMCCTLASGRPCISHCGYGIRHAYIASEPQECLAHRIAVPVETRRH